VGALEKKVTSDLYDTSGNLLQFTPESGVPVAIIWGYNKTQPIAKIENASYSLVASLVANLQTISDTGTEASLLTALISFRATASLANTMITTYTYKPGIGVSTITDPKGDVTNYEYDGLNRLKWIKDKDGKILSENQYHYKN
jgi:YD repeat-containing protein